MQIVMSKFMCNCKTLSIYMMILVYTNYPFIIY